MVFVFFLFLIGAIKISSYFSGEKVVVRKGTYLLLKANGSFEYQKRDLSFNKENTTFFELIDALDYASRDLNIKGVVIENMNVSASQKEEILKKLRKIRKSGKKIFAFLNSIDNSNYYLASIADKVVMPPSKSADISLKGYYYAMSFYKRLLDKIGVDFTVIHMGNYKGAGEGYVRTRMSKYLRENMESLLDGIFSEYNKDIAYNRGIEKNSFLKNLYNGRYFFISPQKAQKLKLVDELMYEDQFFKKYGISKKRLVSVTNYAKTIRHKINRDKIAVIIASGPITMGKSGKSFNPLMGGFAENLGAETFIKSVEKAVKNSSVKGIIVRVDSPGGSALASDLMWHALKVASKKKPVYVSMGNVAASGGYYISSAASKIFADKMTITGSIGVVAMIPNLDRLYKNKLYIDHDVISKGKYAGMFSPGYKFSKEDKKLIADNMHDVYMEFKSRVAAGRGLSMKQVEQIAQGKVYTGKQALEIGLVDKIGAFDDVLSEMKMDLHLNQVSLIYYPKKKSFFETMFSNGFLGYLGKLSFLKFDEKNLLTGKPLILFPYYYMLNN